MRYSVNLVIKISVSAPETLKQFLFTKQIKVTKEIVIFLLNSYNFNIILFIHLFMN